MRKLISFIVLTGLVGTTVFGQPYGDPTFRKKGIHAGNKVRTVFFNYGLVAGTVDPQGDPEGEWPIGNPGNEYIGDVSPLLGVESEQSWVDTVRWLNTASQDTLVNMSGNQFFKFEIIEVLDSPVTDPQSGEIFTHRAQVYRTFHSVGTSDGPRGWTDGPIVGGNTWTFEPIPGFANPDTDLVALSTDLDNDGPDGFPSSEDDDGMPDSWPLFWPDKMNDVDDPGWPGSWNGYFGKNVKNADQESYFVMDDNNDREFNYKTLGDPATGLVFRPDSVNDLRFGMGLTVTVRGLQWSHFLAEDAIFWLYDVTNDGTTDYRKSAFGMMVGTLAGGRCGDSNDDLAYFDAENDITYSFDNPPAISPCFEGPVGYAGYAFLESPGNPFDGIDNDGDNDDHFGVAPYFDSDVFDAVTYNIGDEVVVIDEATFERSIVEISQDTTELFSQGRVVQIIAGETVFKENVENLLDDNLNGIIDEDTLNHYSNRINRLPPLESLLPLQYWDYRSGLQVTDLMLDETRADGLDNDGDWDPTTDDVGLDGVAGTSDEGEGDGLPTSGYQPTGAGGVMEDTGLPGEPHVDKTDIDESDQIGLTSFTYFTPPGKIRMNGDENLWDELSPSIDIATDIETNPVDGDFIYGAGFFPMQAKQTERFSVGLVFGEDFDDILNNKITIQQIYDNNYNFAKPPDKPLVRAVPGDGRVTLYWNDVPEFSYDPVSGYDFEGYKIYRATDFGFNEVNTITDGFGNSIFYEPVAQFDLNNDIEGFFPGDLDRVNGAAFYLGKNTGLRHSWTDSLVTNGQRYFYAVVSYDRGDVEKNIYPAECSKTILELNNRLTFDANTVQVTPNARVAGYIPPGEGGISHLAGNGTGTIELNFLDDQAVKEDATYELSFLDMSNDGIDNDGDWVAFMDIDSSGTLDSLQGDTIIHDTGSDGLWAQHIGDPVRRKFGSRRVFLGYYPGPDPDGTEGNGVPDPGEPNLDMLDPDEMQAITSKYFVERIRDGGIRDTVVDASSNFNAGNANYQYIMDNHGYKNPDIRAESPVVDGVRYVFNNLWRVDPDNSFTVFDRALVADSLAPDVTMGINVTYNSKKRRIPHDYRIEFFDETVDTSMFYQGFGGRRLTEKPINFKIYDETTGERMEKVGYSTLNARDFIIYVVHETAQTDSFITWSISFSYNDTLTIIPTIDTLWSDIPDLGAEDQVWIYTKKPFSSGDVFSYSTNAASVATLNDGDWQEFVRVVPNPYVAAASWEPVNQFATGRGQRRIDFIHLPADCEVRIYTIRGDHIETLYHDGVIFDGTVSWDLRTKEGLDVSYGVYLYHIDAGDAGETIGKFAIIK